MISSFETVIILCCIALLAILLNLFKTLPKFIFVFFTVSIVVAVSWYAMGVDVIRDSKIRKEDVEAKSPVFMEFVRNIVISPGETRFSVPVFLSGKRRFDCLRMVFESDDASFTEQVFLENVQFFLLAPDGSLTPESLIQISKDEVNDFPRNFVLKVFFSLSEMLSTSDFRCVVQNGLNTTFRVSDVSVGSHPFSETKEWN